jgi:nucleoside permease NupC
MTNSELHVVMTGGFATIAGGVLAAYISFNISAAHLIAASVMSAPAALAASKLMMPGNIKCLLINIIQMPNNTKVFLNQLKLLF